MNLKNNRGITLIELIVSISLISVVVMFLFRLLVDVRYSDHHTDFNRANQQTRAIIIKTIQQDFLDRKFVGWVDYTDARKDFPVLLEFRYADGTSGKLAVYEDYLTYENAKGIEKWWLEKENSSTKYNTRCVSYSSKFNSSDTDVGEFFYVQFTIPVLVSSDNENHIDDLELFYIGELKDIELSHFPNVSGSANYVKEQCGKTS